MDQSCLFCIVFRIPVVIVDQQETRKMPLPFGRWASCKPWRRVWMQYSGGYCDYEEKGRITMGACLLIDYQCFEGETRVQLQNNLRLCSRTAKVLRSSRGGRFWSISNSEADVGHLFRLFEWGLAIISIHDLWYANERHGLHSSTGHSILLH